MRRTMQQQRAEAFHRLHAGDGMLVLVNEGTYTAMTTNMLSAGEANSLFSKA